MAVALSFTACNEDVITTGNDTPQAKTIIKAYTETSATRTALSDNGDGFDVVWSTGDKFTLGSNEFELTGGAETTSGTFEGTLPADGNYTACYPTTYNGTDWPTTQTYTAGNIVGSPMTAAVTVADGAVSGPVEFKNAGGILCLTVKGSATVKCVTVNATELSAPITLDCGSTGVALTSDGVDFYIAMPANTTGFTGVSIKLTDTEGKVCTKTLKPTYQLVINRSEITPASFMASTFDAPHKLNGHGYVELAGSYWAIENVSNEMYRIATGAGNDFFTQCEGDGTTYSADNSNALYAAKSWGGADGYSWTLPSASQWQALLDNCTSQEIKAYPYGGSTIKGYLFTDKTDITQFIFLPAVGNYNGSSVVNQGTYGYYWASDEEKVFCYGTYISARVSYTNASNGFSVRPVAVSSTPAPTYNVGDKVTVDGHEGIVVDLNHDNVADVIVATMNVGATAVNGPGCLGNRLAFAETYTDWSGWRLPIVDELITLCNADYPGVCGSTDAGEPEGSSSLMAWYIDGDEEIDLCLPLNGYDENEGQYPCDKYWTGTTDDGGNTYYYFAPEINWEGGGEYTYYPLAYDDYLDPYEGKVDKDNKFLVRLFHDLP